jgi:hypothetical protein
MTAMIVYVFEHVRWRWALLMADSPTAATTPVRIIAQKPGEDRAAGGGGRRRRLRRGARGRGRRRGRGRA